MQTNLSARQVLERHGVRSLQPVDLEAIAESLGVRIRVIKLEGCEGRIWGCDDTAVVSISKELTPHRQRFCLAHELGHWMEDRGQIGFFCSRNEVTTDWTGQGLSLKQLATLEGNDPERRANRYGVELLMPSWLFRPALEKRDPSVSAMRSFAAIFDTSLEATAIRMIELTRVPAVLMRHMQGRATRVWRTRSFPRDVRLFECAPPGSVAVDLLNETNRRERLRLYKGPKRLPGHVWIPGPEGRSVEIVEDSFPTIPGCVLTLLQWVGGR